MGYGKRTRTIKKIIANSHTPGILITHLTKHFIISGNIFIQKDRLKTALLHKNITSAIITGLK